MLKSSASMYESSGSQFFRTMTGMQSGPDAFDESRFVMTFLKLVSAIFNQVFIFSPKDSPSKTIRNVFYFIEKALFVLEIFNFS